MSFIYVCACVFVISHSVEVTSSATWSILKELEDPKLRVLAERLPNTILHSHAESTVKKYLGAFRQ